MTASNLIEGYERFKKSTVTVTVSGFEHMIVLKGFTLQRKKKYFYLSVIL